MGLGMLEALARFVAAASEFSQVLNNTKSDVSKNYLSGLIGLLVIDMVANLSTRLWISPVLLTNCTASLLLLF